MPDRYAHRIDDLGPFSVLDAAATCDDEKGRISLTIVNRGLSGLDESEIVLRDATFAGQARIRVQISAGHERHHLDRAIEAFTKAGKELGVLMG